MLHHSMYSLSHVYITCTSRVRHDDHIRVVAQRI